MLRFRALPAGVAIAVVAFGVALAAAQSTMKIGSGDIVADRQRLMKLNGASWKDAQDKFKAGNIVFGLKQNGVGIGKISPKVPKSEVAKVNQVRADIISGKIKNIPTEVP